MRVPLSWLKEYVALPADPQELVDRLTLAGLESAGVQLFGLPAPGTLRVKPADAGLPWDRDKILTARVRKIEKHPEADKLKLVTLEYGAAEPKTVVTGAPNIAPGESGQTVVLGLKGSRYYFQKDPASPKTVATLEPKKLRGIDNDAMCMSDFELGISDDHDGIILLDTDTPVGIPYADVAGEVVVELDVLPNMARCLGLLGVAREVAALTAGTVTPPAADFPTSAKPVAADVNILDAALCPRYRACVIDGVRVGPSPGWLKRRLGYAGMRPINAVVDVTNFVMLETGQPLHAFDYDVLVKRAGNTPPTITVRPAKPGEMLVTLDGQTRELSPANLVIADAAGPIALAGVMGGRDTEVTAGTTTVLLEAAAFDFVSVRRTARQFNLFSEASTRYSRGIHPHVVGVAADRACHLFAKLCGGTPRAEVAEQYPAPPPPQVVELTKSEIRRVLGVDVPEYDVERVLKALDFTVEPTVWGWTVTTPPTRLDIQSGPADLIEELARVAGYDRLPGTLLAHEMPPPTGHRELELEDRAKDLLADAGLYEAVCYSLTSPAAGAKLFPAAGPPQPDYVTLVNPGAPERSVLRRTLLPGLLDVAALNLKTDAGAAYFELGPVFLPTAGDLPAEPRRLAAVLVGRKTPAAWDDVPGAAAPAFDFFDLKGVLESLLTGLNVPGVACRPTKAVPHLHPGRGAELLAGETVLGTFGELHPVCAAAFDLAERAVLVAELDFDAVQNAVPPRVAYRPFSGFQAAKRDVVLIVPAGTPAAAVTAELFAGGGDLLTAADLFDVYTGDRVPPGTKSLAFALTYQAADRTLTEKEIEKAHQKVEARVRQTLGAQVRGKDV